MFFRKIFKKEDRRKVKDRRRSITINPKYIERIGSGRRNYQDRGSDKERRSDVGRNSGIYYEMSDKQNNNVDTKQSVIKRKEDRYSYKASEFTYVELRIGEKPENLKMYTLKVKDCSSDGLGILITKKDFNLIQKIREGDRIQNVSFFSPWSLVNTDVTVTHKTKIERGEYKDCYIIGLKSEKIIENYSPVIKH